MFHKRSKSSGRLEREIGRPNEWTADENLLRMEQTDEERVEERLTGAASVGFQRTKRDAKVFEDRNLVLDLDDAASGSAVARGRSGRDGIMRGMSRGTVSSFHNS